MFGVKVSALLLALVFAVTPVGEVISALPSANTDLLHSTFSEEYLNGRLGYMREKNYELEPYEFEWTIGVSSEELMYILQSNMPEHSVPLEYIGRDFTTFWDEHEWNAEPISYYYNFLFDLYKIPNSEVYIYCYVSAENDQVFAMYIYADKTTLNDDYSNQIACYIKNFLHYLNLDKEIIDQFDIERTEGFVDYDIEGYPKYVSLWSLDEELLFLVEPW